MSHHVMILEDDPFIALDMESVMEDAGYNILGPVATSSEAFKILKDAETPRPDCALLDFYITGGTSEFVARELTRLNIPYMFVTGNEKDVRNCFAGQDPLIRTKPVVVNRILEDVESLLA